MEKVGIKETTELAVFIVRLISAGDRALVDGKIDFTDLGEIFVPLQSAKAGLADANLIPAELGDLSGEELAEINRIVSTELVLRNVNTKAVVEDIVNLAGQLAVVLTKIKSLRTVSEG